MTRAKAIFFAVILAGFGFACGFRFKQFFQNSVAIINNSGHSISHLHVKWMDLTLEKPFLENGEAWMMPPYPRDDISMVFTFIGLGGREGKGGDPYFGGAVKFSIGRDDKVVEQ